MPGPYGRPGRRVTVCWQSRAPALRTARPDLRLAPVDTPTQPADPLVGLLLDGRYRLDSVIDRGGMATVYLAADTRLDRPVAVKVMHRALADDPAFVARFAQEARSAARLSVPEVVQVHDQGRDPATGLAYLVMEHVRGTNLRRVLDDHGALRPDRALDILEPVLRALDAAHRAGLVHHDVKPENVLLADDSRVKVADFGLARAVESSGITGPLLGTPAYVSPEQAQGLPGTPRSDVYAAGVLLWEMLTGSPPYAGDNPYAVVTRHVNEDVPPPGSVVPGLPRGIDDLAVLATRRDPAARPRDAGALLAELRAVRGGSTDRPGPRRPAGGHPTLVVPLPVVPPQPTWDREPDTQVLGTQAWGAQPVPPQPAPPQPDTWQPDTWQPEHAGGSVRVPRPPVPGPGPGRRRGRFLLPVALVLCALLALAGGWRLGTGRYTSAPEVVGMTQAQASDRLRAAGLTVTVGTARFDEEVDAGRVLSQDPGPRGRVSKDGAVELVLSKGPDRRRVPTVRGGTQEAAEAALEGVGLRVGKVTRRYSSSVPEGAVVSSTPKAGSALRPDSTVALVVSRGVEQLRVPDEKGRSQSSAVAALEKAGFDTSVTTVFSDDVDKGAVVEQSPSSGTAARGSTVRLTVSKGPELVTIPDLEGLDVAQAEQQLAALGLAPRRMAIPGPGIVRNQSPGAGTQVEKGSDVTLFVF